MIYYNTKLVDEFCKQQKISNVILLKPANFSFFLIEFKLEYSLGFVGASLTNKQTTLFCSYLIFVIVIRLVAYTKRGATHSLGNCVDNRGWFVIALKKKPRMFILCHTNKYIYN